jgi:hypothetical protein
MRPQRECLAVDPYFAGGGQRLTIYRGTIENVAARPLQFLTHVRTGSSYGFDPAPDK